MCLLWLESWWYFRNNFYRKKQKKKNQNKLQENAPTPNAEKKVDDKNETVLKKQEEGGAAKSLQVRSFPNGLTIEELAMGKPDGKRASPGKKVMWHFLYSESDCPLNMNMQFNLPKFIRNASCVE